jgi:hypothetical protein
MEALSRKLEIKLRHTSMVCLPIKGWESMAHGPVEEVEEAAAEKTVGDRLDSVQWQLTQLRSDVELIARHVASINDSLAALKAISDAIGQNPLLNRFFPANTQG